MSRYQLSPIFGVDQNGQAAEGLFQKVGWMFKIIVDAERRVLVVETSGLGTVEEVAKFAKEKEAILCASGWAPRGFSILMHTLDTIPQPQSVIKALQEHLHSSSRKPHRIAVVKGGAIAGMQTRRILTNDNHAHFATIEEARDWLAASPPIRSSKSEDV